MQTGRIRDDEDLDDYKGMTQDEIAEMIKKREAQANARLLEMVRAFVRVANKLNKLNK